MTIKTLTKIVIISFLSLSLSMGISFGEANGDNGRSGTQATGTQYKTLKELTFDVQETLNIDPNVTEGKTPKLQEYFEKADENNPPIFLFILYTINFAIRIMGSIAVVILILGGLILILSGGNDTRVEKGKNTIKYAIIGISVALMAYVMVLFVQAIFTL